MASKNTPKKSSRSPKPAKKTEPIEAQEPVEPSTRESGPAVVGIGASAGGLEALRTFFEVLPAETGMAFVVITHLHPEHESHMAELLQRSTPMPVRQVTEMTPVEPNHVYVIPPGRSILMTDTHLDTREFDEPHGKRTPIDHFFRSMAASGHSDPVAIILSGGGTDGSVGIKDVKEVGGLIMVQQPQDAEYDSMPRAALNTGIVDVVLPVASLAERLTEFVKHRRVLPHDPAKLSEADNETLQRILSLVHTRTGHDFSQYKRSTVLRRIERRIQLNGFASLDEYLAFLRSHNTEANAVFNDILIGVTNFFRDRESWEALQSEVIPRLYEQMIDPAEGIRVWSIGCATGEEAYTIAMLLFEEAERRDQRPNVQVFASDLDERSIARARDGLYPAAIEADVSPERLERFFTRENEYYRIKREVRDAVLFTHHNVMRDPPFSHQDLIACRNVLIYLQRPVQDWIFDLFHYSLNPDGFLFLGTSESAEHLPQLFHVVNRSHRIYQVKPWMGVRPHAPMMPFAMQRLLHPQNLVATAHAQSRVRYDAPDALDEHHQRALESFGPPSLLVNERYTILHVSETAGRYLLQPKGPVTGDVLKLVRPELQMELRSTLMHAFETGKATVSRPVTVEFHGGHRRRVFISVRPRIGPPSADRTSDRRALVIFIEDETVDPNQDNDALGAPRTESERDAAIAQLQSETQRLREQLQITQEEYESSNEEMKAANEELQSINEEYRSATEELETSKEELQSVNEELQTVNVEMRNKLDEVSRAQQELENLMGATEIATLYLDRELRISRFTAGMQQFFNLLSVDRGRSISDLTHKLEYGNLVHDAEQVLRTLVPMERELQKKNGDWLLMRLRVYRTRDDRIAGVVVTFIDITDLKETEAELLSAKAALEERIEARTRELASANQQAVDANALFSALFNANPVPTAFIRLEDEVVLNVNAEFLLYFNLHPDDVLGHSVGDFNFDLGLGKWDHDDLIDELTSKGRLPAFEAEIVQPNGAQRNVLVSMQYISQDGVDSVIATFIDITQRVRAEREIRSLASDLTVAEQEERRRLSQILHDDLQQRIFAVKMQTSLLRDAYKKQDLQTAQVDFEQLEELLDESISITRNLSIDLSPAVLQGEGLADALVWLAAQMYDQYGLQISIHSNGISTRFEDTLRILLFQAVRESLFNVVKHSEVFRATVAISKIGAEILITVSDQGRGFDVSDNLDESQGSGGLMNIRHRLQLMGCDLEIKSQPGQGTRVIIHVPPPLFTHRLSPNGRNSNR